MVASIEEGTDQSVSSRQVDVTIVCQVRQGARPWKPARLVELSPVGFRIAWLPNAREDVPLRVCIPGLHMLSARICWINGNSVGCAFTEPLHPAVFEHVVRTLAV